MMLGRTARGLFWMFRSLERAENTARLLEAGWHMALTRSNEWESIVETAGMGADYREKHTEYTSSDVINYMLRDTDNPSSIMNTIAQARSNAREVRTALSSEVWEATNECWMAIKEKLARPVSARNLHETLSTIRYRTSVVRGALHGTMLRTDIYNFCRLGTFIERADNTARILDVKYYILLPSASFVGSSIDNAQWEVILRCVSGERAFRWLFSGEGDSREISEFLILDERMPRSLLFCISTVHKNLVQLERSYEERYPSQNRAAEMRKTFEASSIEGILQDGLHEFLRGFISQNMQLAATIETDFRFYK